MLSCLIYFFAFIQCMYENIWMLSNVSFRVKKLLRKLFFVMFDLAMTAYLQKFISAFLSTTLCVFVSICVHRLYQTLQSIGLRFIRYLRVRVRATCALHAPVINTTATHPAWPWHFCHHKSPSPTLPTSSSSSSFLFLPGSFKEVMESSGSTLWDLNTFNAAGDGRLMANAWRFSGWFHIRRDVCVWWRHSESFIMWWCGLFKVEGF